MPRERDIKLRERLKNKKCMSLPGFRIFLMFIEVLTTLCLRPELDKKLYFDFTIITRRLSC